MTSPQPRMDMTPAQAGRDVGSASVGELIGEVAQDLSTLMRQELTLAKAEVKEEAARAGKAAGMAKGWAALVVTAVWAVAGAVLFVAGRRRIREVSPKPERTTQTVRELPDALKGR
jgi:hypothetical protein